jgi:molybdopterin/thiamine biosynthesis adenylyltransferase
MLKPWWERWPGRLEHELEALKAAGISFAIEERARAEGVIKIDLRPLIEGEQLNLQAIFPDLYPYFRFELLAPDLNLAHHQNPFAKNLCLIGRSTSNWSATDILADFIKEQLPLVLKAARAEDPLVSGSIEEHQGEPLSTYYNYRQEAILLVDSSWSLPPEFTQGELMIGLGDQPESVLRGVVVEIRTPDGKVLSHANPALSNLYQKRIRGKWFRVGKLAHETDPRKFLEAYLHEHKNITRHMGDTLGGWQVDVTGVVFPEELGYREKGDGWIFVIRASKQKSRGRIEQSAYFARAGRAGLIDLSSRIPELAPLHEKRIAVIGLGCIGAPSALEFARSGIGELRVLDRDIVETGTIIRWPFGIIAAGLSKADVIRKFVAANYPYTKIVALHHNIGNAFRSEWSDLDVLHELLDGVDLIYDATAEIGLQHLLSDIAAERNVPYVCVSTTPGGWGGLISRIQPGRQNGCWSCLQRHLEDSSIPCPPNSPAGTVQPRGWADPTFTGAGFDIGQIALAGVRLAVASLSHGSPAEYPDFEWDIGVIALRDVDGRAIAPNWKTFPLTRHLECTCGNG